MTAPDVEHRVEPLVRPSKRPANTALHMVGLGLTVAALGMVASLVVGLATDDDGSGALAASASVTGLVGLGLWRGTRIPPRVRPQAVFTAVTVTWVAVSVASALPFFWSGELGRFDNALFESVSGITATGATVLSPIEGSGRGILFWRQLIVWYGGMGMIVLAVAVLPFLGVGGLHLIRAEAPGPTSDRLAPRVSETAKRLWFIYLAITGLGVVGLLACGTTLYDAVTHSFAAVATGGFSPYNANVTAFDSVPVELVLMAVMLAGATSFTLHWRASQGEPGAYWASSELRFFAGIVVAAVAAIAVLNVADGMATGRALRDSSFYVVSLVTTTGFTTVDYTLWVPATQIILLFLMVTGGMAGSTAGGVKIFRVSAVLAHATRELRRARTPSAVLPVKLGTQPVPEAVMARIAGFVILYFVVTVVGIVAIAAFGADLATPAGAAVTAMGGVGPGLGVTGPVDNFLPLSAAGRGVMMVLMLLGRLEIFPVLLMFAGLSRVGRRSRRR